MVNWTKKVISTWKKYGIKCLNGKRRSCMKNIDLGKWTKEVLQWYETIKM